VIYEQTHFKQAEIHPLGMKKIALIFIAFNLCVIELSAQLQAQPQQTQAQIQADSMELDSVVLYQDKLMELGKTNFVSKDVLANFKGKRFEKAAVNINKKDFDALVQSSIAVLKTKEFEQITDVEHRNIIRAINTISAKELTGDTYDELEEIVTLKDYAVKMTGKYKWAYTQGMGFAFLELGIDLDENRGNENLFIIKN
jgi:hypothetical protein